MEPLIAADVPEKLAQRDVVRELVLARGHDDQHPSRAQAPARDGEESEAELVGPVQILEHDAERTRVGKLRDELHDALEEP